jgi:hypothetical protein
LEETLCSLVETISECTELVEELRQKEITAPSRIYFIIIIILSGMGLSSLGTAATVCPIVPTPEDR